MELLVLFIVLFILLFVRVPIGFSIAGATAVVIALFGGADMSVLAKYSFTGLNSFSLLAIPFFILAGGIMATGGLAKRIVNIADKAVGFITGGLGMVLTLGSMFFAALSGSAMATVSAIGGMMIPEMKRKKYDVPYSATLASFAGTIGIIIPPSIPLVVYGVCTQTNVGDLFIAGVMPGILLGVSFMVVNYFYCRKNKLGGKFDEDYEAKTMKQYTVELLVALKDGFWALLAPVFILGSIYAGICTPTEAAVVAVVYSLLVSLLIYREMTLKDLYKAFKDACVINGITVFIVGTSTAFANYLTQAQVPGKVCDMLLGISDSKIVILLIINIFLLILGCFMDNIPATLILAPILLPAVEQLGMHPVHFGVMMTLNLAIGLVTPPYGANLFVGAAVAGIKMQQMMKHIIPLLIASIVTLMLVTYVPFFTMGFLGG